MCDFASRPLERWQKRVHLQIPICKCVLQRGSVNRNESCFISHSWNVLLKLLMLLTNLAVSWNTLEMCCCLLKRLKLVMLLKLLKRFWNPCRRASGNFASLSVRARRFKSFKSSWNVLLKLLTTLAVSWNTLEMCCYLLKRLKLVMLLKLLKRFWNPCRRASGNFASLSVRARRFKSFKSSWNVLLKLLTTLAISWNTLEMCCCLLKRLKRLMLLKLLKWFAGSHGMIYRTLHALR